MAVRKQLWHPDETRQKIKTSQLINRLQNHALFEDVPENEHLKAKTVMTDSQVRAAFGLIDKVLPSVKPVDPETGDSGLHIYLHQGAEKV